LILKSEFRRVWRWLIDRNGVRHGVVISDYVGIGAICSPAVLLNWRGGGRFLGVRWLLGIRRFLGIRLFLRVGFSDLG